MAIKINWQDLLRRYINWQEIVRVYKNGGEVRPNTVPPTPPAFDDYLCFTRDSSYFQASFRLYKMGSPTAVDFEISYDKETWTDYARQAIILNEWEKVYIRNKSSTPTRFSLGEHDYYYFSAGHCIVSGNISSLLCKNGTNTVSDYCFCKLFARVTDTDVHNITLPATTLAPWCYYYMFNSQSIKIPPQLPATTLAQGCYANMFQGAYLEALPQLPATTLAKSCYAYMFAECYTIKISDQQDSEYTTPYRIPSSWTWIDATNSRWEMFRNTSWVKQAIPINTTYYTSNTVI